MYKFKRTQAQLLWDTLRSDCTHYRTASGIEVDFTLENKAGEIVGIEIKSHETIREIDFKGLKHLQQEQSKDFLRGIVLYPGGDTLSFGPNLYTLPLSFLWS